MLESKVLRNDYTSAQRAFSKQSDHYDADDFSNLILTTWRRQVYDHIDNFIKPKSRVLELNAGTGIDALHLVQLGHQVHATDAATGMLAKINQKIYQNNLLGRFTSQQCSFESLEKLDQKNFDYVFSNFGGLNCCDDLSKVTSHLANILNEKAIVTWVIMPKVSLWELLWIFKSRRKALRRFKQGGTLAHVEGEYFKTYYHSLSAIKKAFGDDFVLLKSEGLGVLTPPPGSINFSLRNPRLHSYLQKVDSLLKKCFPFNRCGDHIIVTFQFKGK